MANAVDPRFKEIENHRAYLARYALAQLRDAQLAEEAVQEALLAALESVATFDGRSTLRTWLTSILRFKVIDIQRRLTSDRARLQSAGAAAVDDDAWLDDFFDETGHWRSPPQSWNDPETALDQSRFWAAFEACLGNLSAQGGRVFFKREVLGEDTEQICNDESITQANCWVMLHRARIVLRSCLEQRWFGGKALHGS